MVKSIIFIQYLPLMDGAILALLTSAIIHTVLICLVDFLYSTVLNMCIVITASFYCVGIKLVDSLWCRQGSALCQNGSPMTGIFSLFLAFCFWIWIFYMSVCKLALLPNSAQDMKRTFEGGHSFNTPPVWIIPQWAPELHTIRSSFDCIN